MTAFQAAVLGFIQGLGEFLPISSSAHLTIAPWLFGWTDPGLTFDVALHVGTLAALLVYFWRDWLELFGSAAARPSGPQARLLGLIIVGSLPAAVFGLLFEKRIEESLRSPALIAVLLLVFGLILEAADRIGSRRRSIEDLSWPGALFIGLLQSLALAPGVSRSGSTLTGGLFLGLKREDAARFSFLLATPVTAGAALLKLRHLTAADLTLPFWLGIIVSAITGMLVIGYFMNRMRAKGLLPFTVYRVAAGLTILAVYASRR